jgi:hypothetical protein
MEHKELEALDDELDKPEVAPESQTESDQDEKPDYSWVPRKFMKGEEPDFTAMSKAYQSLEKKLGSKGSIAPESIDEYAYESRNGAKLDPDVNKSFREEAQKVGMSQDQYAFVMGKYEDLMEQFAMTPEKAQAELKTSWGKDYDANIASAKRAFDELAPSDVSMDEIGNNPAVIKLLARVGMELGEDKAPPKGKAPTSKSIDDIRKEMSDAMRSGDYYKNPDKYAHISKFFEENSQG